MTSFPLPRSVQPALRRRSSRISPASRMEFCLRTLADARRRASDGRPPAQPCCKARLISPPSGTSLHQPPGRRWGMDPLSCPATQRGDGLGGWRSRRLVSRAMLKKNFHGSKCCCRIGLVVAFMHAFLLMQVLHWSRPAPCRRWR